MYFDNAVVEPHQRYEYDSLYRLVGALGREHGSPSQTTHADFTPETLPHPNDPDPLHNEQTYVYDEVGNITRMRHEAGNGAFSEIWRHGYEYAADGNRLLATSLPGDDVERRQRDARSLRLCYRDSRPLRARGTRF